MPLFQEHNSWEQSLEQQDKHLNTLWFVIIFLQIIKTFSDDCVMRVGPSALIVLQLFFSIFGRGQRKIERGGWWGVGKLWATGSYLSLFLLLVCSC